LFEKRHVSWIAMMVDYAKMGFLKVHWRILRKCNVEE